MTLLTLCGVLVGGMK